MSRIAFRSGQDKAGAVLGETVHERERCPATGQNAPRKVTKRVASFSLFLLGLLAVCLVFFSGCQSGDMWMYRPPSSIKQELRQQQVNDDDMLYWILRAQRLYLRDVNRDGKIDCIDYTVSFKRMWDDAFQYRGWQQDCIIMQNNNPNNGFNHAFIMVRQFRYPFGYVCIEPQANNLNNIYMKDYWGDKYDPAYDTYDYEKIKYWYDKCIY